MSKQPRLKIIGNIQSHDCRPNQQMANNCRRRMEWTREWIQKNSERFPKHVYMTELNFRHNETYFFNWHFTMTELQFRFIIRKLGPKIVEQKPFRKKKFFSAEERLSIALKYLATGDFHSCKLYSFRAPKPVIFNMICDICLDIYESLKDEFLTPPKTEPEWLAVSKGFSDKFDVTKCLGSVALSYIVGKKKPSRSSSELINGVLTTIVDASGNFLYVDVNEKISETDTNTFVRSNLHYELEENVMSLPEPIESEPCHYFVGHKTLPIKTYLLRALPLYPNGQETQNFCIEGKQKDNHFVVIEQIANISSNVYIKLANIFPILSKPLDMDRANGKKILLGCITLYNFLRKTNQTFLNNSEHITVDINEKNSKKNEQLHIHETRPVITVKSCFRLLEKQIGDEVQGQDEQDWLMDWHSANNS